MAGSESEKSGNAVSLRRISKRFPGVRALDDVTMDVRHGEIMGLVGKNGAGKSTLINVLAGLLDADEGNIEIGDRSYSHLNRKESIQAGVAVVPQHSKLIPSLSVAENMLCGELPVGPAGFVDWRALYARVDELLARMDLHMDSRRLCEHLKTSERKLVEIARAIFSNARLVVLDEPTASLPLKDIERLFDFVRRMKADGVSFIYISHHLQEVFDLCDRVTVMRDGKWVGTYEVSDLDDRRLASLISGGDARDYERAAVERGEGGLLELKGLSRAGEYADVDLTVAPGQVVGLTGLRGSGAMEVAQTIYGLRQWDGGTFRFLGEELSELKPSRAVEKGIGFIPEDRLRDGVVAIRSVRENITFSVLKRLCGFAGFLSGAVERDLVGNFVDKLEIKVSSPEQPVGTLSGGNQQKVLFARAASIKPRLLVLLEPTQGVDVRAKAEIYAVIDDLSRQGIAIIIVSTELNELLANCDVIKVFFNGRLTKTIDRTERTPGEDELILMVEGK